MEVMNELRYRYSTRSFSDRDLDDDVLQSILEAGRIAPSAKNRQPWRFIIIKTPEMKKKIENAAFGQDYVGEAPVVIAACSTNIDYRMPNGQSAHPIDIAFAASQMTIQAASKGVGSCIVSTFNEDEVKDLLSVPFSMQVVMLILLGYPGTEPGIQPHRNRLPLHRIVSYEHW